KQSRLNCSYLVADVCDSRRYGGGHFEQLLIREESAESGLVKVGGILDFSQHVFASRRRPIRRQCDRNPFSESSNHVRGGVIENHVTLRRPDQGRGRYSHLCKITLIESDTMDNGRCGSEKSASFKQVKFFD